VAPDELAPGGPARLGDVESALLDRRIVVVTGELDAERSSAIAATLLTLDATGDDRIELRLHSCSGALDASLALMDVLDVVGVEIHGVALGTIEGGPVGVLVATSPRRIAAHARLRLRVPDVTVEGSASEVQRLVAAHAARGEQFLRVLAARCRRSFAELDAEWERGASLEADDAVTLGYADVVLDARGAAG